MLQWVKWHNLRVKEYSSGKKQVFVYVTTVYTINIYVQVVLQSLHKMPRDKSLVPGG